jgi:hypothetical protein
MNKARVPLLFGTMTLGEEGKNGARNHEMKECQSVLDTFFSHGYTELDTARAYSEGTTEQVRRVDQLIIDCMILHRYHRVVSRTIESEKCNSGHQSMAISSRRARTECSPQDFSHLAASTEQGQGPSVLPTCTGSQHSVRRYSQGVQQTLRRG